MIVVGIDEVGRGCLAGPLVACAAILYRPISGLNDSKLLSKKQRQLLLEKIRECSKFGLGWVSAIEVDKLGLTKAVSLAMRRAYARVDIQAEQIIIDGNYNYLSQVRGSQSIVGADQSVPAVSAASIVAKEARDAYMYEQALIYKKYNFEKNVGYGTKSHIDAIKRYGVCKLHRRSFRPIAHYTSKGCTV